MILRDLGATVVKVEPLPGADPIRGSDLFDLLNRGKYSVSFASQHLSEFLASALPKVDILLTNYRLSTQAALGLSPEAVLEKHPHLIYVNITAFSDDRPGHDLNFLAESGVLERMRALKEAIPIVPGFLIGDILGGTASALVRVLAALYARTRTGRGEYIPVSMREELLRWSLSLANTHRMFGGELPPPGADFLSGGMPCYRVYSTKDGRYIAVAAIEEKFWAQFCSFLGREDLIPYGRVVGDPYPHQELEKIFASASWQEWRARLDTNAFCVSPVYTFAEAIQEPWASKIWREGFLYFSDKEEGTVPRLGEHNTWIEANWGISLSGIQ
ncbi:MAG: CoA transferase [Bacteroidia bacterium]|nr:CoA transferase [Bacteroidia bacterium]